jgi:hypothetical protein
MPRMLNRFVLFAIAFCFSLNVLLAALIVRASLAEYPGGKAMAALHELCANQTAGAPHAASPLSAHAP